MRLLIIDVAVLFAVFFLGFIVGAFMAVKAMVQEYKLGIGKVLQTEFLETLYPCSKHNLN